MNMSQYTPRKAEVLESLAFLFSDALLDIGTDNDTAKVIILTGTRRLLLECMDCTEQTDIGGAFGAALNAFEAEIDKQLPHLKARVL
jgi:hypothetical protein